MLQRYCLWKCSKCYLHFINFINEKTNSERLSYHITKLITGSQAWSLDFNNCSFQNLYKRLFLFFLVQRGQSLLPNQAQSAQMFSNKHIQAISVWVLLCLFSVHVLFILFCLIVSVCNNIQRPKQNSGDSQRD